MGVRPIILKDEDPKRLLVRETARRILEADWSKPTRADVESWTFWARIHLCSKRLINGFIKCNLLLPKSTLTGLVIEKGKHPEWEATLDAIVDAVEFPTEIASVME